MFYFVNFEDRDGVYIFAKNEKKAKKLADKVAKKFDDFLTEVIKVDWESDKKIIKPIKFNIDKYSYLINSLLCEIEANGLDSITKFQKNLFKDLMKSFSEALYFAAIINLDLTDYKRSQNEYNYSFDSYTSAPL